MKAARILVIDDHQIVREGVRSLISAMRPAWIIAEAGDGDQAVELIRDEKPDLLIMDITLPGPSGLEIASRLRKSGFDRPILMFTMHKSPRLATDAQEAGAQGYVLKSQAVEDLIRALDTLLAGGTFFGEPSNIKNKKGDPSPGLALFRVLRPSFA
jgi:two-component system, NarL family, invasion response regulator UvrY